MQPTIKAGAAATRLPAPTEAILGIITNFWLSQAVNVAARLRLSDHLAGGPRSVDELAAAAGADAPSLRRILRALASYGIYRETSDGRYEQTPVSEALCSDGPDSLRAFAMAELGQEHYVAWGNLLHSARTGEIAFDHTFKTDIWSYYAANDEHREVFTEAMSRTTHVIETAVAEAYDFTPFRTIIDIGGGQGSLLAAMLRANPRARGVLFDRPEIAAAATSLPADRCEVVGGDFFQAVSRGGDLYTMKWIIHDWAEEKALTILRNIRQAMAPGGRLLLIETVLPESNEPHFGKLFDLNMMVMTGGQERTASEYAQLLARAGFRMTRVISTSSLVSLVEAVPAD